jgi:hypothetical protein
LVDINDNILAVFVIESLQIKDLYIAKNSGIDKSLIEKIYGVLVSSLDYKNNDQEKYTPMNNTLGYLLWDISEYNKLRILKIYENEKIVVVLIKSNTKLEHSVNNILGYYFESDDDDDDDESEIPKSLF